VFLAMVALGGTLELLQGLVGRDSEWGDFFANDLGAVAGLAVAVAYLAVPRRPVTSRTGGPHLVDKTPGD
jgi:VanZ family protein